VTSVYQSKQTPRTVHRVIQGGVGSLPVQAIDPASLNALSRPVPGTHHQDAMPAMLCFGGLVRRTGGGFSFGSSGIWGSQL
jgi:hypothetical protein